MFKKVKRYVRSPYYALGTDLLKHHPDWMSDKYFLRVLWKQIMGYPLNLNNPQTFNEKLQWMKLYDRNPLYTTLVDKHMVKQWVADRIGAEYVIPTLAVYDSVDEIDVSKLPNKFVLKCNHDSGGLVICKNKSYFNLESAKSRLSQAYNHNFYLDYREWPYKHIDKKIIAEEYLEDSAFPGGIPDYKFFTFDGKVVALFVATDRNKEKEEVKFDFYDSNFHLLNIKNVHPNSSSPVLEPPKCFFEMKRLACKLSTGIKQARIDFYEVGGRCYFGEITFFHGAGFMPFSPMEFDLYLGGFIKL